LARAAKAREGRRERRRGGEEERDRVRGWVKQVS
jgi:hypothetical protein